MRRLLFFLIILSLTLIPGIKVGKVISISPSGLMFSGDLKIELVPPAEAKTPSSEKVRQTLAVLVPDIKILMVKESPVKGLWEIGFESGGKKGILYLDNSYNFIIAGNLVHIKTKTNLTQASFAQINKVDLSLIPYEKALVMGDKKAKHRIAVFDDVD